MAGSVLAVAMWFHLRWNLICNFDCLSMDLEGFAVRCGWSSPVFSGRFDLELGTGCQGAMPWWWKVPCC
ncbi:hypothetical protein Nepgr_002653 [Nepenthes gracilis]|uniref:Secreted protein n=1 Tax=Nepenthes gracilis TaxID=150966 RepID=A0AAD3RXY9_NEPGR|nr:hypothetical protein Nepgr_002653 [Nepenthes gracilis]